MEKNIDFLMDYYNKRAKYCKNYQKKNKDKLKNYSKDYREKNKEKFDNYYKDYRERHKEIINCECGGIYNILSKNIHFNTQKHIKYTIEKELEIDLKK